MAAVAWTKAPPPLRQIDSSLESVEPTPSSRVPRRAASVALLRVSAVVPEQDTAITRSAAPISCPTSPEAEGGVSIMASLIPDARKVASVALSP